MPVAKDLYYFVYHSNLYNAPPIVLIHGAGGNYTYFPPEIRRMNGFRIYAVDLPGHGKSGGVGKQTIQDYANSLLNWMDYLELYKVILVGHSMGGAIAMTLADNYPERVIGLGLVSTGARLRVAAPILENSMHETTFPIAVELLLSNAFSESAEKRMIALAQQRMLEVRPSVLYSDMVACDRFDLRESLLDIMCPTLVLCGDMDKLTPLRYSQYLADSIPNAQLKVIPDAGHMVILEKPVEVKEAISDFAHAIPYRAG